MRLMITLMACFLFFGSLAADDKKITAPGGGWRGLHGRKTPAWPDTTQPRMASFKTAPLGPIN